MASKNKIGWNNWTKVTESQDAGFHEKLWAASESYGNGFEPDVDAGLARFKNRISKTEAKVVPMKSSFGWLRVAAALVVLIGVGVIFNNLLDSSASLQMVSTETGITKEIKLTDGTVVWLNENSELSFPNQFEDDNRTVILKGEGYFDVAKNPNQPFFINTENGQIQVLGTAFNLRSLPNETYEEVYVEHGKVAFSDLNKDNSVQLIKTQKARLDKNSGKIELIEADNANDLAWKTKKLSFKKVDLKTIFENIERHCNVDFEIVNKAILNCRNTVSVEIRNVDEALKALEFSSPNQLKFEKVKKGLYKVSGNACLD